MFNITVLVSGGGSNLQSLIDAVLRGRLNAKINMVISDRDAYALTRASEAGIPNRMVDRKIRGNKLSDDILAEIPRNTDLIVLAGYLSILSSNFIDHWRNRIINIHPSLLPDFGGKGMYGMKVHQAVLQAGRKESGCSVHFIDNGIDTGEIIMRKTVPVLPEDTPEQLQSRVLEQEHLLIVDAVELIIRKQANNYREGLNEKSTDKRF